jgi:Rrf2 family protein
MLSATCQYALRALAYLASVPRQEFVLGRELARQTRIPPNYLSKILLTLGNNGIIEAVRGSGGGYRLTSPPDQTSLMQVVELFDRQVSRTACLLGLRSVCSDADPCMAHHVWREAKESFFAFMEGTTLADICYEQKRPGRRSNRGPRRREMASGA